MEPGIPAPLAGLIYAALGSLGADLAEEQHPSAAMVATVVEIFENGVSEQVGQKVLGGGVRGGAEASQVDSRCRRIPAWPWVGLAAATVWDWTSPMLSGLTSLPGVC